MADKLPDNADACALESDPKIWSIFTSEITGAKRLTPSMRAVFVAFASLTSALAPVPGWSWRLRPTAGRSTRVSMPNFSRMLGGREVVSGKFM